MKPPALVAALAAAAAATAGSAHADEPQRPVAPLGWRFGIGTLPLHGELRFAGNIGVARGFTIGKTRVSAEYSVGLLSGASDDDGDDATMAPPVRGTAHRGTGVVRFDLWTTPWGNDLVYLDGELGAELMLAYDSRDGRVLAPSAVAGVRFGCELFHRNGGHGSPTRTMDSLLTLRLHADRGAVGVIVSTGLDFGR